jgi:ATP-dependent DNA ligase
MSPTGPLIARETLGIPGSLILNAEVVCLNKDGVPDFDALHDRTNDHIAVACAFDVLMRNGQDLRKRPYIERKAALRSLLPEDSAIQYVEHAEGQGYKLFEAACSGLRAFALIGQENRKPGSRSKIQGNPQQHGPLTELSRPC